MIKLIIYQLKYSLSKNSVYLLSFLLIISVSAFFFSLIDINKTMYYEEIVKVYFQSTISFIKIIIIFLSCYLSLIVMSKKSLSSINFIITCGYSKKDNIVSKYLLSSFFLMVYLLINYIIYNIIGYLKIDNFYCEIKDIIIWFRMSIVSNHYIIISMILIIMFNEQIGFVLTFCMFLVSEILVEYYNRLLRIFFVIFPNIIINDNIYNIPSVLIMLEDIVLIIILINIYERKDYN